MTVYLNLIPLHSKSYTDVFSLAQHVISYPF